MAMVGLAFSALGGILSLVCTIFILIHAFQKSVGTGFMVLCIPCYVLYYMFSVFEHEKKNMIIAGYFVGVGLSVIGNVLAQMGARGGM